VKLVNLLVVSRVPRVLTALEALCPQNPCQLLSVIPRYFDPTRPPQTPPDISIFCFVSVIKGASDPHTLTTRLGRSLTTFPLPQLCLTVTLRQLMPYARFWALLVGAPRHTTLACVRICIPNVVAIAGWIIRVTITLRYVCLND